MRRFPWWSVAWQGIGSTLFTWFTFIEMTADDLLFISIFVWAEFVLLAHCCCCCWRYYCCCCCCYLICATYILYQFLFAPLLLPFGWLVGCSLGSIVIVYDCCNACVALVVLLHVVIVTVVVIAGCCLPLNLVAFEFALTA